MTVETVRGTLGGVQSFNMGLPLYWFLFMTLDRNRVYRMHCRWYRIPEERFDAIHYTGILMLKITIFVFTIVPYPALHPAG